MAGMSGGMEKVVKKFEKRESQARWKARMWGGDSENRWNCVALLSESTGIEKVAMEGGSMANRAWLWEFGV